MWSSLITVVSVAFFAYIPHNGRAASVDWTVPAFAVLLPLFGLVWWGFQRREGALRDLAEGEFLMERKSLHCLSTFPCTCSGTRPPQHDAIAAAAQVACASQLAVIQQGRGNTQYCMQRRARSHRDSAARTAGTPRLAADAAAAVQSTLSSGVAVSS